MTMETTNFTIEDVELQSQLSEPQLNDSDLPVTNRRPHNNNSINGGRWKNLALRIGIVLAAIAAVIVMVAIPFAVFSEEDDDSDIKQSITDSSMGVGDQKPMNNHAYPSEPQEEISTTPVDNEFEGPEVPAKQEDEADIPSVDDSLSLEEEEEMGDDYTSSSLAQSLTVTTMPPIIPTHNVCPERNITVGYGRRAPGSQQWTQVADDILGEDALDSSGSKVDMSADGSIVAIGASWNEGVAGRTSGHVRVYKYSSEAGTFSQLGQDIDGVNERDWFGSSVALDASGLRLAAGARFSDSEARGTNAGHVRVFDYNDSTQKWEQIGNTIDGISGRDQLGTSVSLSDDGTRLAVGSSNADGFGDLMDVGHVYIFDLVFEEGEDQWKPVGVIIGDTHEELSGKAMSLSADGSHVAIGSPRYDSRDGVRDVGRVKVYRYDAGNGHVWSPVGKDITSSRRRQQTGFALAISTDGSRVAVTFPEMGSGSFPFPGVTKIFDYQSSTDEWVQVGTNDLIGSHSVSMSESGRVTVGDYASYENGMDAGTVRIFDFDTERNEWYLVGQEIHGNLREGAGTAAVISADGSRVAISSPRANRGDEEQVGATRIFDLC